MKGGRDNAMGMASRPKPESGLELYAWIFMRVSGVVLLIMALTHLVIMHLINNIDVVSYEFVAKRYATPFWRTYDLVMLWLALIHGVNGSRTVLLDYVHRGGLRVVSLTALYVVGFIMLALGSLVILTFHPVS
ncbi:MAG TPA: succinate dehydrogenase, hydrophobic membrane anchor protein [Terriglobia bacterium]|nr:succinate dehydrogenase, hydrophobic membrane anchor protein [Terriglobia bacterium]